MRERTTAEERLAKTRAARAKGRTKDVGEPLMEDLQLLVRVPRHEGYEVPLCAKSTAGIGEQPGEEGEEDATNRMKG